MLVKKTVAHLYGTNLKASITKVKIIDQNGVEWPIHTKGSDVSASDYPMMLIGKLGNGISGDGTYQEAEIVLPNSLDKDMTFTYTFAPDGVNFDENHKVTAVVEKTGATKSGEKRSITVKYQTEDGKELKKSKVLNGYSWFKYNIEKPEISGYKNIVVKDNKSLTGVFGDEDKEIVLVYTNNEVITPNTPEKPQSKDDTLEEIKEKLAILANRDLKKEAEYDKLKPEIQSAWKKARAKAQQLLANDSTKEELEKQLTQLGNAIKAIEENSKVDTETPTPSEDENNKPQPENPISSDETKEQLIQKLQKLVLRDLREDKDYVANQGNQPTNNEWIRVKTEAENILHNTNSTKEELVRVVTNLETAINNALLGSEKVKAKAELKIIDKPQIALPYIAKVNKAKTVEEVRQLVAEAKKAVEDEVKENKPVIETIENSKAKLEKLVDKKLKTETKFNEASKELQSKWKRARAMARKLLADNDTTKEQFDKQIKLLQEAINEILGD
ncbi:MucBP domain-containing protein [Gemella sp. Musashino-2025]